MPGWVNVVLRSVALIVILFFLTKSLGKRQLSQLNIFEFLSGLVLAGTVAHLTFNPNTNLIYGLIAIGLWFIIPLGAKAISLKSKTVRDFVQGKGTIFIQDGKVMEDNLKKENFTTEALLEQLRNKIYF